MNIATIYNININAPVGIIGIDKDSNNIGYATNDEELEQIIEIILNNHELKLPIKENINNSEILRYDNIKYTYSYYLVALNYYLPYPYRILNVSYADNDLELALQENFNYIGDIQNEKIN